MNVQVLNIKRTHLVLSQTPMQQERRKHRTAQDIKEIGDTLKSVGQIHPILVRPDPLAEVRKSDDGDPLYEVVAGEGRYLGAEYADIDELRAEVRELSDEQVEEIQLIENLRRKGLHELVEAEGYEALMKRGHSVEQIVEETGATSKAYVYARLKLLALCEDARQIFRDGKVSASIALLIARIPVADLQKKAVEHITKPTWSGDPMSYRDAARYVQETFMLRLTAAPFLLTDAKLVPGAGACGPCPMRTGNSPDLFGDIGSADVCTNPQCFKAKKDAHLKRELDAAKNNYTGMRVIRGEQARRVLGDTRYTHANKARLRNGFARPTDKCPDDKKKRTYAELAGKDAPMVLLQNPDTGLVEKVFQIDKIADRLKKSGVEAPAAAKDSAEAREQHRLREEKDEKIEVEARRAIFQAVIAAAPRKLAREDLAVLLSGIFEMGYGSDDEFYAALGWEQPKNPTGQDTRQLFLGRLLKLTEGELAQLAVALPLIDVVANTWHKPTELEAVAKRLGVNPAQVRAEVLAPHIEPKEEKNPPPKKKAPAKASKKKAARKAK
jgi:ParB/RepB/Spo0J family partition protein